MIIRIPKIEPLTPEGIPQDFAQVMEYFNNGLSRKAFPFIPRKKPITVEEIRDLWVPSLKTNLSYVAVDNNRVIGSATVLFDVNSNAYEDAKERQSGELALTVDPKYSHTEVGKELIREIIRQLRTSRREAILHTDADFSAEKQIMVELGYFGKPIERYARYEKAGLSGRVLEYHLPGESESRRTQRKGSKL